MTKIFTKEYYEEQLKQKRVSPFADTEETWSHWCPEEQAWIQNLRGEGCNWCDTTEESADA